MVFHFLKSLCWKQPQDKCCQKNSNILFYILLLLLGTCWKQKSWYCDIFITALLDFLYNSKTYWEFEFQYRGVQKKLTFIFSIKKAENPESQLWCWISAQRFPLIFMVTEDSIIFSLWEGKMIWEMTWRPGAKLHFMSSIVKVLRVKLH